MTKATTSAIKVADWEHRLEVVYETMRELSLQTDPQDMVKAYGKRLDELFPVDRFIALSRRGLEAPRFRVTRFSEWKEDINPWKQKDRLPLLEGGLFAELLYSDRPIILDEIRFEEDDPAAPYLQGQGSLIAIPMLDQGVSVNMVILAREKPAAFDRERFPDNVWMANLFGRATHNLVLSEQVRTAYEMLDRELKVVADIQRSLLPDRTPEIATLELATYYRTSHRAGGDYYDFFPLPDGKWGLLIADVSGHGTPAAVVMAITHAIAHLYPSSAAEPGAMLAFVNERLASQYTHGIEAFVTAFYGIYDPVARTLDYASAGHNPPRLWRCADKSVSALDRVANLPLGMLPDIPYPNERVQLQSGDRLVFYTDGITEAYEGNEFFGVASLDRLLDGGCDLDAESLVDAIVTAVDEFTAWKPPSDDRTLVVARVR